ncbi:hypothetical protein PsorP6_016545 [Peronosclerospora sorghi]|uniref:Uncharacterized protein n=1 Tax=Peronosclerospora sorghi TaxID=230839 RepID=A0ACC0VIN8_9STRA|nr:hypothetical protein PsorP6_016545 [Peronosclerospora sorghi]
MPQNMEFVGSSGLKYSQYTWLTLDDDFDLTHNSKVLSKPDGQDQVMQLPLTTPSNDQARPMDISLDDAAITVDSQMMLSPTVMSSHDNNNTMSQDHTLVRAD